MVVNVFHSLCSYLGSGPRFGGGHLSGSMEERQLVGLEYKWGPEGEYSILIGRRAVGA